MKKKLIGGLMVAAMAFSGAGVVSAAGISSVNSIDLSSMDIETALKQVESQRSQMSQQMDMLRLQSMTDKRNEAFDVMTNFIKKMQDSRSSIIGNMR
ncbi:hypothetical protein [Aneurinibacillus uraniidurans]|uniref:hypothetical protein n=1 Tax=Aneurinibacillus uraniidurans TaxID=2966586 RepID=UPI00234BD897|nr:hypothetical protein [Aneurinibacillus sp. B1]WCN36884.1 hypothetical protein PO771_13570 [Aneurinibacillus sp. B1]